MPLEKGKSSPQSDQPSGQKDEHAADYDLENRGEQWSLHVAFTDPGDDRQFHCHHHQGDRGREMKIGDEIGQRMAETADGDRLLLNVAFNYAGRTELVDAFRRIVASGVRPEAIDETTIAESLYTAGLPDPDLVIRTGGEQRLSNFLIWQSAYAEFYSTEVLWPDFGAEAFDAALLEFARRTRRFGR